MYIHLLDRRASHHHHPQQKKKIQDSTSTTRIHLFSLPPSQPSSRRQSPMASNAVDGYRQGAEIYHGDDLCKKKVAEILKEAGLPAGLLRVEDVEEVGYNRDAGFLWVVQKKKTQHTFKAIKETVSYAAEVTALVERGKLKKITGVKVRELLLWISVVEVYIDDPASGKITFKTGAAGLADSFPISAFELEA